MKAGYKELGAKEQAENILHSFLIGERMERTDFGTCYRGAGEW